MALAIADRRLLSLGLGATPGMGMGGEVKTLVSEAPLEAVDSIEIKRLLMGKVVKVTVRGNEFKLEAGAGAAEGCRRRVRPPVRGGLSSGGDVGLQLGPGFLRRPPRGWLTAQVSAVAHRAWEPGSSGPDGGQADIDTACLLDARWRVELPGREPYEFDEQRRTAPTWVLGGAGIGAGRRWYKVRLKPTFGLMDGVAFPCFVDPSDPEKLWIDWDAAYEAHIDRWGRHARVERELARRENLWEYAFERVMNPFAGRSRTASRRRRSASTRSARRRRPSRSAQACEAAE